MLNISNGLALGLLIVPILAFLIIIHELGHFFAARSVGVKVEEFGIGIPPRARAWRRNGVLWSINWIPFGGFVRVKGEDGADMSEGSMNRKGPAQRAFFLVAGSAMNFLAAIILSIVLVAFQGVPDTTSNIYIATVANKSPAAGAGWQPGDTIHAVEGEVVTTLGHIQAAIGDRAGEEVSVTLRRGDEFIETSLTPRENPPEDEGATGISMAPGSPSILKITDIDPGSAAAAAGWQSGDEIVAIDGIQLEAEAQARNLFAANIGEEIPVTVERDGETVETTVTMPQLTVSLTQVLTDTPASDARLYPGDEIVAVAGEPVVDAQVFLDQLRAASGSTIPVDVFREGRDIALQLAVPTLEDGQNPADAIGVNASVSNPYEAIGVDGVVGRVYNSVPAAQVLQEGWGQFWWLTTSTVEELRLLVIGEGSPDQLRGPIGMGQVTSEVLANSVTPAWVTIGTITMAISLGLGVLNLLPFPALDGGRLLFVMIEVIRGGRRISPEKEGLVHLAGMVVLLGLMFFVAFGDVSRLVDGRSIFP